MEKTDFINLVGESNFYKDIEDALHYAEKILGHPKFKK